MTLAQNVAAAKLIDAIADNIERALLADGRDLRQIAAATWPKLKLKASEQRLTRLRQIEKRIDLVRISDLERELGLRCGELLRMP